jgi:hypothetical protein
MLSNLPIAKCRKNYIINTNYFSILALIILVEEADSKFLIVSLSF